MKRYALMEQGDTALTECTDGDYCLASDVAELERRLIACESAMLVGCDTSHRAIVGYMQTYPDPYSGS